MLAKINKKHDFQETPIRTAMNLASLVKGSLLIGLAAAQTGAVGPIAEKCGPSAVCVNKYGNILP